MIKRQNRVAMATLLLFLILFISTGSVLAAMPSFGSGEGVYLLDPDTGDAFAKQNEDSRYNPASTTKLMTALVAMDYINNRLSEGVTVGEEITQIDADSSVADLAVGDTYTWEQLLYGLLLPSGNDAAMTIAVNIGRLAQNDPALETNAALDVFVGLMNKKAGDLGLTKTHFANPHGLVDANHYTTPKEMAQIAGAAFGVSTINTVASTPSYTCVSGNGQAHEWENSNILIHQTVSEISSSQVAAMNLTGTENPYYNPNAKGGKTGYDEAAGRCLVFSGQSGEMHLVGVIFKASDQRGIYSQADGALDTALKDYSHILWSDGQSPYVKTMVSFASILDGFSISASTKGEAASTVLTTAKDSYSVQVKWDSSLLSEKGNHVRILAPITEGQQIGTLDVYSGSTYIKGIPLYTDRAMSPLGWVDYLIMGGVLLLVVLLIVVLVRHRRKKRNQAVYNMRRAEAGYHFEGIKEAEMEAPKETPVEDEGLAPLPKSFLDMEAVESEGRPSMPLRARLGGKTRYRLKRIRRK